MDYKATIPLLLAFCTALFCGCTSNSPVATTSSAPKHPESIAIKIIGGSEAAAASASQVSRPQFAAEVAKSLRQSNLFGKVISGEESGTDYRLEITLADLQKPEIGASMTATVEATWTLVRVSNGYEIWKKAVSSSHTTQASEAFTGVERLRLAVEGAALANIHDGLRQLDAASIP